jgi:hypothetical protein
VQIQPRTTDLVIATHGRSIGILNDTRPFRELTPEIAAQPAHLLTVAPVNGGSMLPGWVESAGKGQFRRRSGSAGSI